MRAKFMVGEEVYLVKHKKFVKIVSAELSSDQVIYGLSCNGVSLGNYGEDAISKQDNNIMVGDHVTSTVKLHGKLVKMEELDGIQFATVEVILKGYQIEKA